MLPGEALSWPLQKICHKEFGRERRSFDFSLLQSGRRFRFTLFNRLNGVRKVLFRCHYPWDHSPIFHKSISSRLNRRLKSKTVIGNPQTRWNPAILAET
jgi:hypothetical protein